MIKDLMLIYKLLLRSMKTFICTRNIDNFNIRLILKLSIYQCSHDIMTSKAFVKLEHRYITSILKKNIEKIENNFPTIQIIFERPYGIQRNNTESIILTFYKLSPVIFLKNPFFVSTCICSKR